MNCRFFAVLLVFLLFSNGTISFAQDADSLRMQGDEAYKTKNYDKAIELYKASLKINGKNWQVHEALGNAYFKAKKYAEAAASYAEALGYNSQLVAAYYNIGFSYFKAGLFNEAIKYLGKYVTLKADDPDGYYRLADAYYSVAEKENAIINYEKFLSMAGNNVSQKKIGDAKAKLNELKGSSKPTVSPAVVPVTSSTSQNTNQPSVPAPSVTVLPAPSVLPPAAPTPITSQRGNQTPVAPASPVQNTASESSKVSGGTTIKTSTADDPAMDIIKEADNHLANGNYRLAITTYRDALIKSPNSIQAHYNLGIALAKVERYEQAISEWEKVLQLDPQNAGAKENIKRAKAKMSGGTTSTGSVVSSQQPIALQQPTKQVTPVDDLLAKANKANSSGDYASAVRFIDELMIIKKNVAEAYVIKGDALLGMGKYLEAINEYKKAIALNPQLASPLFGMAESYRLLAKTDMAIQYYKLFLNSPSQDKVKWRVDRATKMLKALESIR